MNCLTLPLFFLVLYLISTPCKYFIFQKYHFLSKNFIIQIIQLMFTKYFYVSIKYLVKITGYYFISLFICFYSHLLLRQHQQIKRKKKNLPLVWLVIQADLSGNAGERREKVIISSFLQLCLFFFNLISISYLLLPLLKVYHAFFFQMLM